MKRYKIASISFLGEGLPESFQAFEVPGMEDEKIADCIIREGKIDLTESSVIAASEESRFYIKALEDGRWLYES